MSDALEAALESGDPADDPGWELPPPNAPMEVARVLVNERYTSPSGDTVTLRHWRGGFGGSGRRRTGRRSSHARSAPPPTGSPSTPPTTPGTRSSRGRRAAARSATWSTRSPRSFTFPRALETRRGLTAGGPG